VNDPDWAVTWPPGVDGELPERVWAPGELTVTEELTEPDVTGSLISLAFIRQAVRRRARVWCVTALLGLLIGSGLYLRYPPAYHAQTSVLLVDNQNVDPATQVLTDQSLAESEPVAARVVQQLGLHQSVASFQAAYTVTVVTNNVLTLNVGAPSSAAAVQRASALASSFLQYRAKYAQTQEQQLTAELQLQYNAAEQRIQAVNTQISQLPTTNLTPAQTVQLAKLQTQLGDQKQITQYVTSTEAAAKTSTAAMVSGSNVLNPPTAIVRSRVKSAALYVAGGLFGGLVAGMAWVIIAALLSDRLRRRDDVAAALGTPVKLSVGSLPARRRLPVLPRRAAKQALDMKRVVAHLRGAVLASSQGRVSLAVVAVDDVKTVAPAVASLARSCAQDGRRVVVADLSGGAPLARMLGAEDSGVSAVTHEGVRILVAVPDREEVLPIGPVRGSGSPPAWAPPDEALVTACASADLLLTLVTLDPATGGGHLATWASEAIAVVTAGRSSAEKVHSVGVMIRLAGTRLDSAVLIGADRDDESLGVMDPAQQSPLVNTL
jgi:capsular polysaccharide biosynthesis protein